MKTSLATLLAVLLTASAAHADDARFDPTLPRQVDLSLPALPPPSLLDAQLDEGRHKRNLGIGLLVSGVLASIAGTGALIVNFNGANVAYPTLPAIAGTGLIVGAVGIGSGAGLVTAGNREMARARGIEGPLTPEQRRIKGRRYTQTGAALTGIGAALSILSLALAFAPIEHDCGDVCGLGNMLAGGTTGALASTFVAAGIPLISVGASYGRSAERAFELTSVAPSAMPGGGGVSIGGRF